MRPEILATDLAATIRDLFVPVVDQVKTLDGTVAALTASVGNLTELLTTTRTELAELAAKPPEPGPEGPPGPPGRDGKDGKDGTPGLRYCGVYVSGKTYDQGDLVTAGGSAWYCQRTTTTGPGDSRPDWTLMVKHGRDLRDPARRTA